jgi:hypothetical protein
LKNAKPSPATSARRTPRRLKPLSVGCEFKKTIPTVVMRVAMNQIRPGLSFTNTYATMPVKIGELPRAVRVAIGTPVSFTEEKNESW